MTVAEVKALFATPEKLLRKCYLHIGGGATRSASLPDLPPPPANGQAEVVTFSIVVSDFQTATGFTTGFAGRDGETKTRPFVKITKLSGPAKAQPGADEMNAYYVPMVQTSDIRDGTSHYTLPTRGEPSIMITSKLSGCRFAVGSSADGALLVTHGQPNAAHGNDTRQATLQAYVESRFAGRVRSFALGETYTALAAVIGVRDGKRWRFYQQASHHEEQRGYVIDSVTTI
jgi:hypothetical protein